MTNAYLVLRRGSSQSGSIPPSPKKPRPPKSGIRQSWTIKGGDVIEWHRDDTWHVLQTYFAAVGKPFGKTRKRIARHEGLAELRRNGYADPYKEMTEGK